MTKPMPVPPALAEKGFERISSNLPAGMTIDLAGPFMQIFGDEAQAQLLQRQADQERARG